jgi:hypothetical protein
MAKKQPALVEQIHEATDKAAQLTEKLVEQIPSLTTDDIRKQRLVNELDEAVHRAKDLEERLRAAELIARRGARVIGSVA